uniref:T-complex protein 1 subunit theta n=1 Tax=Parascaris univalens TaxID=6257 RepID=A0A915BFC9_PARUN
MALSVPKSGYARFLKEGTQTFKGTEEAVQRNIEACVELASQIRSAYGPSGMNKMIINHVEKLFVTNDAATILKELEIQHPAARMIIMASEMQEKQIGDGTNTVVILAAALLEHASQLLNMGLSAAEIASGYEQALDKALQILPSLVVQKVKDLHDVKVVESCLKSAVMSKQYDNVDFIAALAAKACVQTVPKNTFNFNVDNIRVCKILGAGVRSSSTMNGMVFRRGAEGEIKEVTNARIVVFACPFDLTQTETKGTVLMETASDLLSFSAGEESEVESQVKALANKGVTVVVAAGKFGDLYLHFLNKYKIMGVRLTSKFDLRRLCRTTGAQAQARVCAPGLDLLGQCDHVFVKEIGDTEVVVFDKTSERGNVATVIVRGSSQSRMDDVERAIDDAVNTFKALTRDNQLVAGAGAVEIELAKQIDAIGEKCAGLEQYPIRKFAQALEALPKQLADNAGLKASEVLAKLYAAHEEGHKNAGVDLESGGVLDAVANNIFDLYSSKKLALKLATDAAITVLKVDQIIMSKQATGGPKPRGPKPQDEEDEEGMS